MATQAPTGCRVATLLFDENAGATLVVAGTCPERVRLAQTPDLHARWRVLAAATGYQLAPQSADDQRPGSQRPGSRGSNSVVVRSVGAVELPRRCLDDPDQLAWQVTHRTDRATAAELLDALGHTGGAAQLRAERAGECGWMTVADAFGIGWCTVLPAERPDWVRVHPVPLGRLGMHHIAQALSLSR